MLSAKRKPMPVKVGQVVRLNSNGPQMTVMAIEAKPDTDDGRISIKYRVLVLWFTGDRGYDRSFPLECLSDSATQRPLAPPTAAGEEDEAPEPASDAEDSARFGKFSSMEDLLSSVNLRVANGADRAKEEESAIQDLLQAVLGPRVRVMKMG